MSSRMRLHPRTRAHEEHLPDLSVTPQWIPSMTATDPTPPSPT